VGTGVSRGTLCLGPPAFPSFVVWPAPSALVLLKVQPLALAHTGAQAVCPNASAFRFETKSEEPHRLHAPSSPRCTPPQARFCTRPSSTDRHCWVRNVYRPLWLLRSRRFCACWLLSSPRSHWVFVHFLARNPPVCFLCPVPCPRALDLPCKVVVACPLFGSRGREIFPKRGGTVGR
jgi:hypothetical protein